MKTLAIIGIVWACLCWMFVTIFMTPYEYEACAGWGMFASIYLLAFSIVVLVKTVRK